MNVNQLKDNIRKIKTSVWYKNIFNERILTYLKEKAPLYVDGARGFLKDGLVVLSTLSALGTTGFQYFVLEK